MSRQAERRPVWIFDLDNTLHDANPHIFPRDLVFIVERRVRDDDTADRHRLKPRHRRHHRAAHALQESRGDEGAEQQRLTNEWPRGGIALLTLDTPGSVNTLTRAFNEAFQAACGCSPRDYRKAHRRRSR